MHQPVKLENYEEFQVWFATICPLDEYGFHVRQAQYWIPETLEQEIERIESNLAYYKEFMKNKSQFPKEVHQQRAVEFHRFRELRGHL